MTYFRHYWEAPDDSGSAPVEDAPEETTDAAAEAPEEAQEPLSFTPEDDAEDFGSRFQRFAENHDDPRTARQEYGRHVDHLQSAFGRLSQGGEWTDQDKASAEALGFDLPQPAEEAEEEAEPIWGAPWAEPSTYEDLTTLAQSDPGRALVFIDKQPEGTIDPTFRQQVLAYWASPEGGNDAAGMVAYEREKARTDAISAAKTYAEQLRDELRTEFGDVRQKYEADTQAGRIATVDNLALRARSEIPDFAEHEAGVIQILSSNVDQDPTYLPRLLALPAEQQLQHISDLTGAAAWRNRPQAAAEAEEEAAAQVAAKTQAGSERGRGAAGSSSSSQSAAKKKFTEDIKRGLEVV